ncbi:MAG: imidazole glycerol phosphate synthase subunit HisH [Desulfamplus sp.]|nr:imidazole glycerol phosphate synthase subunit HisH [Desulfamplus sp.]
MIVIVDYGAGNLTSVARAVSYLGYDSVITDNPEKIAAAERVIFPGVGAAGAAMEMMQKKGIDLALKKAFESKTPMLGICVGCQIIMDRSEENDALCLGLISGEAREFFRNMITGNMNSCTIEGKISSPLSERSAGACSCGASSNDKFTKPVDSAKSVDDTKSMNDVETDQVMLKVPHMGWNGLDIVKDHPLLKGIKAEDEFYFVHSYFPVPVDQGDVYGTTEYGIVFASAIGRDNLFATQFHLEKSGEPGLMILRNFCTWKP